MYCRNHPDVYEGVRTCTRCAQPYCGDCLVTIDGRDYCAVCKSEHVLDLRSGTGAGILPLASRRRRFAAQFLDGLIVGSIAAILIVPLVLLSAYGGDTSGADALAGAGMIVVLLSLYFGVIAYEALMLRARGQTLGKMALHLRVVREDGSDVTTGQAWGRAVSRAVMVSVLAFLNYGAAFVTKEKTCLHDMLAKTRVITTD